MNYLDTVTNESNITEAYTPFPYNYKHIIGSSLLFYANYEPQGK